MVSYAKRMDNVRSSEIREILKLTQRPEVISFAGGLPDPTLFPSIGIDEAAQVILKEDSAHALQYSTTEGFNPLRDIIAKERMGSGGVSCTRDNILITNGSQQGLDFSGKLFIDDGDVIICESPSYLGAINAFKVYGPTFVEVPMDEDGMIMEDLEDTIQKYPNAKFIYTIPDFQNPSGRTMSVERRYALAKLASKYKIPVIEDSPYRELNFSNEVLPFIKHFDEDGYVITLGSFSKTFCPGLRIGWICANEDILQKYIMVKQGADIQCSTFNQMIAAKYMTDNNLDTHIEKIINIYGKRCELMLECIKKYFPPEVKYTIPHGGLFIWVQLANHLDSKEIALKALEENVAFVPGESFYPNGGIKNTLRLNFSTMTDEKIHEGIKRLGKVLYSYYS